MVIFKKQFKHKTFQQIMDVRPIHHELIWHLMDFEVYQCLTSSCSEEFQRLIGCWLIMPQNFKEVSYLNLENMWYTWPEDSISNEISAAYPPRQYLRKRFEEYAEEELISFIAKALISKYCSSHKLIKLLLWYCRVSKMCIRHDVAIVVFRLILPRLHRLYDDRNVIIEFLSLVYSNVRTGKILISRDVPCEFLLDILRMANIARFNIRRFMTSNMNMRGFIQFCPVLHSLIEGNTLSLELLLQYGFERQEMDIALRNLLYHSLHITEALPSGPYDSCVRRKYLAVETLYLIYKNIRRDQTVFSTDWTKSAYLLFRSISDPYITLSELYSAMTNRFYFQNIRDAVLENYRINFSEIFATVIEPRSLQHLCRCKIRECLRDNFQLPNGIYELNVPQPIVLYLRLNA